MNIVKISAENEKIRFYLDTQCDAELILNVYSPSLREIVNLCGSQPISFKNGIGCIDRFAAGRDGLYLKYVFDNTGGINYCDTYEFTSINDYPYPECDTKKGLQVAMIEDAIELGVKHAALNVCIGDLMRRFDGDDVYTYIHDGREYYFDKKATAACDRRIKELSDHDIIITLILLCSKHWTIDTPETMYDILLHPDYVDDRKNGRGLLSAFNIMTDEGVRHYAAFVSFLSERYTNPSREYGRAVGLIISNEVNSHYIWGNAGEKNVVEYSAEYTTAMRIACQASSRVYSFMRVYVSLDHFWTGALTKQEPEKYTGSRYLLEELNKKAKAEGEFYWNIAFHPYPEDLNYPDFWNDKTAEFNNDTYRITFKNLTVLRDFIYAPENLFRGIRRRVILSEQGFNSHWTPESEMLQATAYGRAYRAVMEIPEIDSFILHAHCDNKHEFGLNLGIWRRKKDGEGMDAPKPIYHVFRAIDKKDETGKWHWQRY